jgi:imidazolonepropionase-like amidohydrolase
MPPPAPARGFVLRGATVLPRGDVADVEVVDGRIARVASGITSSLPDVDASGRFVVPGVIDAHVHLAYLPHALAMAEGGVVGAVDLGAPEAWLAAAHAPLRVVAAGPMLTSPGGYPLDAWGSDGYGLGIATPDDARAAVERLAGEGAGVVKIPFGRDVLLDDATIGAAVQAAHTRGLRVAVHALGDADAARAARLGADVLAHTPVQPLSEATLEAWRGRVVVSTLVAFGGSVDAIANLRALRAQGVTVLYGTDFGNSTHDGVDPDELALLSQAGLDGAAILDAATRAPAATFGLDHDLGAVEPGRAASFLVLYADPRVSPLALGQPRAVYVDGAQLR